MFLYIFYICTDKKILYILQIKNYKLAIIQKHDTTIDNYGENFLSFQNREP